MQAKRSAPGPSRRSVPMNPDGTQDPGNSSSSLVFISHDHRDSLLAEACSVLLTDASAGVVKFFRSSDRKNNAGIEFGAEWFSVIMKQIDHATDVVALLTPNSIDRPWILYEAGVAKAKLGRPVFGVVLGLPLDRATRGPFAQFQNSEADVDSLTTLVKQLIRRNPAAAPRDEAVRHHVGIFLDSIKPGKSAPSAPPLESEAASVAKLFEEIKLMFRRLEERAYADPPNRVPFVTESQIEEIELGVNEEVIVVTRDLSFDNRIRDVVQKNARRGVRYIYLMPDEGVNLIVTSSFLADDPDARRNLKFIALQPRDFHFPVDMVVYDPAGEGRSGYLCLPVDGSSHVPRRVWISDNQSLRNAASSLMSHIASINEHRNK